MEKINNYNELPPSVVATLRHPDFFGRLVVLPVVAGRAISLAPQTTYNLLSNNKFPLPLVVDKRTGKKMVRVEDLLKYFSNLQPVAPARRRGAPLKRARLAGGEK